MRDGYQEGTVDLNYNYHGGNPMSVLAFQSMIDIAPILNKLITDFFVHIKKTGELGGYATSEEVEKALKLRHQTASSRLVELKLMKLLSLVNDPDTGKPKIRINSSGRPAHLHQATDLAVDFGYDEVFKKGLYHRPTKQTIQKVYDYLNQRTETTLEDFYFYSGAFQALGWVLGLNLCPGYDAPTEKPKKKRKKKSQ